MTSKIDKDETPRVMSAEGLARTLTALELVLGGQRTDEIVEVVNTLDRGDLAVLGAVCTVVEDGVRQVVGMPLRIDPLDVLAQIQGVGRAVDSDDQPV